MYISSRHKQHTLANCDHDISICDSKIQVSSVEKRLGVTISNNLLGCSHHLIQTCNSYLFLLSRIKVFLSRRNTILFYNSYILPHLDFCCIISGNCSSTLEDKLVKFQKRAARVILDVICIYHPQNYLKNSIGKHSQKELHIKKQFNQLYTPKPNCELFRKSFMYSGAVIWNSLLIHVKMELRLTRLNLHI